MFSIGSVCPCCSITTSCDFSSSYGTLVPRALLDDAVPCRNFRGFSLVSIWFLVNFLLFAVTVTTSCYILYRIVRDVIRRVQKLTTDLLSWRACARQRLNVRLRELSSHLPKGIPKGLPGDFGQRLPRKGKETRVSYKSYKESESSELEDIEPDYRDRETKLYDALVRRQNITGSDTFDPFLYSVGPS